ncbi:24599_t:CDS:2 [Cetraspora pellucida]|uniref:24599_t:CDS:1 n=1 Tax=Cetraspora pellucida TaxID=1433469 RepID=A0A9N9HBV9_9GLOM|nr:24599_t:CDS:2 [Cetraspora pellucida]
MALGMLEHTSILNKIMPKIQINRLFGPTNIPSAFTNNLNKCY